MSRKVQDPAEYPTQYPPDDPTRTTSPRQALIEPLSPLESHLAEAEALERASETSEAASETRRRGRIEVETHRISEEVTRRAQEQREAEQRRQAQLAVPPDTPPESSSRATTPLAGATMDPLVWELASLHLPDSLAFKRILLPLDGSVRAEQAIPLAARIAHASRASVLLVQVVSLPLGGPGLAPVEPTIEPLLDVASEYLKAMARREELVDIEVHRKVLTGLSAAPALMEAVELYQSDLAVICSHGRSGLTRWALGSVAQKMAQHASVPVLVLRPNADLTLVARPGQGPTVRALVTLDGSPTAEAALLPAARLVAALAGPGHGAVHLLRVLDLSTPGAGAAASVLPYRAAGEAALEDARTYLHAVAQRFGAGELATLGLWVTWSVLDDADAASGILDEAEGDGDGAGTQTNSRESTDKPRYDLIAMATHGRTGLRLWALGSVTDRVLQTTRLPLLIIRPSQTAE
jgi:nucleotide-binding universal stress UspA family protein